MSEPKTIYDRRREASIAMAMDTTPDPELVFDDEDVADEEFLEEPAPSQSAGAPNCAACEHNRVPDNRAQSQKRGRKSARQAFMAELAPPRGTHSFYMRDDLVEALNVYVKNLSAESSRRVGLGAFLEAIILDYASRDKDFEKLIDYKG